MLRDLCPLPPRRLPLFVALAASILGSPEASASLIAGDSYAIGSNPGLGQYAAGVALNSTTLSGLTTPGFATGGYVQGSGTSNFEVTSGGLSYPAYGSPSASDGKVSWVGAAASSSPRSDARAFNAVPNLASGATSATYWFHITVSQDGTTAASSNGFVLAGFGNSTPPTLGATTNEVQGLYFGYAQHGTAGDSGDLVIRYRNGMDTTADATLVSGATANTAAVFDIVARLTVTTSGVANGALTYWVDPTRYGSIAALDASSMVNNDNAAGTIQTQAYAPSGLATDPSSNFARLTYTAQNWSGRANFDEPRFGTTLADVAPASSPAAVPEPGSGLLLGIGLLGGLATAIRRRALA